jgi:hypothetical protein
MAGRFHGFVIFATLTAALAASARADDDEKTRPGDPFFRLDTKNLFGALEGADVGEAGDRSIELETTAALFKRAGRYGVVEQEAIYEITPTPWLGVEFGAHGLGQSIHGAPDVTEFSGVGLSGLSNEWRYVLIPRFGAWNAQATVTVTPQVSWTFEVGAHGRGYALPLLFILDAQPVERRLYAALNLSYTPEIAALPGEALVRQSTLAANAALSWRLTPDVMFGAETDALTVFDGLAAQSGRGSAFFAGPTFHYQVNDKIDLSGAWTQQIAGRAREDGRRLDLANFSRSQAKLRLEIEF